MRLEFIKLIIFFASVFLVYYFEARLLIRKFFKKERRPFNPKAALFVHILALTGIICFLYGYFIEPYWLEVNSVDISTSKLKSTGLRIVQISDLHCDSKIRTEKKLVKIINDLDADIIVFTGDALNRKEALPLFRETMSGLKAKIGKFAVYGNWDAWYWKRLDLYSQTGFRLLRHTSVRLEKNQEEFYVSGIGVGFQEMYQDVLKNVPQDKFSIFLYHYPGLVEKMKGLKNVDLYLAGHIHGGQVALPFYGAVITLSQFGKKYERGRYQVGAVTLYVNRGIGMEGAFIPKVRFFARPEITVFNIKPKN